MKSEEIRDSQSSLGVIRSFAVEPASFHLLFLSLILGKAKDYQTRGRKCGTCCHFCLQLWGAHQPKVGFSGL